MLRKIRIGISLTIFLLLTFYLVDFAGILPNSFHVLAHIQLIPALLGLNLGILLFLLVLTWLTGRSYCSVICPLGIFQDIAIWISRKRDKKKHYDYRRALNRWRWGILLLIVVAGFSGFMFLVSLFDPYSAYGRIVVNVLKPLYLVVNNFLTWIFTMFDNYTFYYMDIIVTSVSALIIAFVTLLVVGYLAYRYGRIYCNTVCPVGTLLGFISKYSLFKVHIDTSKCNSCGLCARKCKASCIDSKKHEIDYSRCVVCFDCIDNCRQGAISYTLRYKKESQKNISSDEPDISKRTFVATLTAVALTALKSAMSQSVGVLTGNKPYKKEHPLSPPGSISAEHFNQHCTACHLCVSKCPSHVLKPSLLEYGVGGILQPVMNFENGFCNYDCTLCSEICPNKAILPLTKEEKHLTQVGHVVFIEENCIVHTDNTNCGACAEHCPTQAVTMVPYRDGLTIPKINPDICVGCGGCEYVCPVRPFRAIHIEGNPVHLQAKPIQINKVDETEIDDFGF